MKKLTKCQECKCWEFKGDNAGLCKRHAPQPTVLRADETDKFTLVWPSTLKEDGCFDGIKRS